MKMAIIGSGKMGKCIEKIALQRGHKIYLKTNTTPMKSNLKEIDVAIEFTTPKVSYQNLRICLENNIPTICGTTGWLEKYDIIKEICKQKQGTFLYSSNFSIGGNIFLEINRFLAKMLVPYQKEYEIYIEETHHTEKKDYPSGTALTLAEIIGKEGIYEKCTLNKQNNNKILITSKRFKNVTGIHIVRYQSSIDDIILKHEAHNINGFAFGVVRASEWIQGKKGIFSMKDVLNI